MTIDFCARCSKRIIDDIYFKVCDNCNKFYCNDCGHKMSKYTTESKLKCIYILGKCFSCFTLNEDSDSDSDTNSIPSYDPPEYEFNSKPSLQMIRDEENNISQDNIGDGWTDLTLELDDSSYTTSDISSDDSSDDSSDISSDDYTSTEEIEEEEEYMEEEKKVDDSFILEYILKHINKTKEDILGDMMDDKII